MKKLVLGYLLLAAGVAGAACMGPFCYTDTGASVNGLIMSGNGYALPTASSTTIVGQNATNTGITAANAGQEIVCNNCKGIAGGTLGYQVCISTAANQTSWVLVSSMTSVCQ